MWVVGCFAAPAIASGATVSFVDERPITRTYDDVAAAGGVKVHVHNDAESPQRVTVRVIGLTGSNDPAVRTFLSDTPVTTAKPIAPGGSALPAIPLGKPQLSTADSKPITVQILASGESGAIARLDLTLTNDLAPDDLSPAFAPDITLTAVNYVPSLLSGLRPALFFLAALLAALAFALSAGIVRSESVRPQAVWIVAAIATVAGLIWTVAERDWEPGPSVHAISSRPIDVSTTVTPGTVGFASSDNGSVARLEVDSGSQLRPQGLTGAASYTGVYDLAPGDTTAGAKATVNVRDWWPFAALVLVLGVLLGVALRNWYQRVRPRAALGIRVSDLLARALALQASASAAGIDLGQQMGSKLAELVARLKELVDDDDVVGAGKKLDELEAQLGRLVAICSAVADLATKVEETKALARQVGFEDFEVRLLPPAEALVGTAVSGLDLNALDADELKERQREIEDMSGLLARVGALYASGLAHRERAVELLRAHPSDARTGEALQTLRNDFDEIMTRALEASSSEELDAVEDTDDAKRRLLGMLSVDSFEMPVSTVVLDVGMWPLPVLLDSRMRAAGLRADSLEGIKSVPPEPSAAISARVINVDESARDLRLEDMVEVTAQISPWPQARVAKVDLRYSDGTHQVAAVSDAGRATDYHVIRSGDPITVDVHSHPDGELLRSETYEVKPETRRATQRRALKLRDLDVARIAAVLAVGSGLVSLYVTDPSWGEPSDYLAAVLWGAVAGEGVKLAVAIADRVWPSAG